MIGTILAVYAIAGFAYWSVQAIKALPGFVRFVLFIVSLPVLIPVVMITSLPLYLIKGGKMYKYRFLVYFTLLMGVLCTVLHFIP